jgi:FtsP/CotA-like multicopper oxidase with cupredoxin domain
MPSPRRFDPRARLRRDPDPPAPAGDFSRRGFLGVAGSASLICALGGKPLERVTGRDVKRADDYSARLKKPASAGAAGVGPGDAPQPQPGGVKREYWVAARSVKWDIVPTGRDEWMARKVGGPRSFRAFVYQQWNTGFAEPVGPASMPGPLLEGEVGDTIVVHFRNADEKLNQAVTMHPHGVRYTPNYDGSYLGDFTLAGGFIAPGEEFTYTWECTPDSVGVWPYHDHGPNHTINTMRGLFGALIVREKGAARPDVENVLILHSFPPNVTGLPGLFHAINGRSFAGNTPEIRASVGQDVAWHVIGGDGNFHTFHIHGHRWRDPAGTFVDTPTFGPNEVMTARYGEDNPGRWLYHCHVFSHQDMGMAGWYVVT